jgi:hypothetical protein
MTQQQRRAVFGFYERKKGKKAREEGGLEGVPRAQGLGGCLGRRLLHLRNTGQAHAKGPAGGGGPAGPAQQPRRAAGRACEAGCPPCTGVGTSSKTLASAFFRPRNYVFGAGNLTGQFSTPRPILPQRRPFPRGELGKSQFCLGCGVFGRALWERGPHARHG